MSKVALQARGLRAELGGVEVLHGIDLTLPAGRWTAVVGPNGAGKTTLLKCVANLLPFQGEIEVLGRNAKALPARERGRLLSWLGQDQTPTSDLSATQVVMLGRLPHQPWLGAPTAIDHAQVELAMRQTQCWPWRERSIASLSSGERQRVLLARALAVQAPVLLMDEPLNNLDAPHQGDWLALVRALTAQGTTVVSVLHELSIALQADDLAVIGAGQLLHHGPSTSESTHAALLQVFDHRIALHPLAGRWVAMPR